MQPLKTVSNCSAVVGCGISPAVCRTFETNLFLKVAQTGTEKNNRKEIIRGIHQILNAFLNEGAGWLCIHADDAYFLDNFEQQLDDPLNGMITDGSLFVENFERTCDFHSSPPVNFRVIYRVKRKQPTQLVYFNCKTKVSLCKGLLDISHSQFRALLEKVSAVYKNSDTQTVPVISEFKFIANEEIVNFVEDRNRQAKSMPVIKKKKLQTIVLYVCKFFPNYISAFSKNEHGGSILFGVREEQENIAFKWQQVNQAPVFIKIDDQEKWKVWKGIDAYHVSSRAPPETRGSIGSSAHPKWKEIRSKKVEGVVEVTDPAWKLFESSGVDVFHVATEDDVPVVSQQPTGKFVCEAGLPLSKPERNYLEGKILRSVRSELLWLGNKDPEAPVTVDFHPVKKRGDNGKLENDGDMCIIEVVVKRFHGVVFTDVYGPEIYKFNPTRETAERLDFNAWRNKVAHNLHKTEPRFRQLEKQTSVRTTICYCGEELCIC